MAIFLSLDDKRTKGSLFPCKTKQFIVSSDIPAVNKATEKIFKFTRSLELMKDSLSESVGVVKLKMIL